MVSPLADFVVSLGTDGRIASSGTVATVLASDSTLAKEVEYEKRVDEEDIEANEGDDHDDEVKEKKDGKLVIAEEIELGHVSQKSCKRSLEALIDVYISRRPVIDTMFFGSFGKHLRIST